MSPPPLENGISRDSCNLTFKYLSSYNKNRMITPFICLQGRIWRLHTVWITSTSLHLSICQKLLSVFTSIASSVTVVPHTHEAISTWRKHNALNLTLLPSPYPRNLAAPTAWSYPWSPRWGTPSAAGSCPRGRCCRPARPASSSRPSAASLSPAASPRPQPKFWTIKP